MKYLILSQEVAGKSKKRIQTVSIACKDVDDFITTIADILSEPRTSGFVPDCTLEVKDDVKIMHIELKLTRHMASKLASESE